MDIVSIFSFVSMVSIVINVDIVIVVSTLCILNNIRSAQYPVERPKCEGYFDTRRACETNNGRHATNQVLC